mmetsp:Transcript_25648/g.60107  ORF Transcript_25648/g.60107 Transcript_25648/m.60107 type:complete len:82 (-) Transcript_25648:477-722(-)
MRRILSCPLKFSMAMKTMITTSLLLFYTLAPNEIGIFKNLTRIEYGTFCLNSIYLCHTSIMHKLLNVLVKFNHSLVDAFLI